MSFFDNKQYDINSDDLASNCDETSLWSAPFGLALLDSIKLKYGINALDLGCGTGFILFEIAQRLGESSTVYGIDPWSAALNRAEKKQEILKCKNIRIVNSRAEEMPFKDNFFSLICSNNGINNVDDQEKVMEQCYRVSKPGAQLVMTSNLPGTMIEFYDIFRKVLLKLNLKNELSNLEEYIQSKRKTIPELKRMVAKSGFNRIDSLEKQFSYRFIDGTALLNYFFIKLAFMDSWLEIIEGDHQEIIFQDLENELNNYSEKNNGINLTIPFARLDCYK